MPEDFKRCKGVVAAWGLGGEAFSFPPEAGYPVGEDHGKLFEKIDRRSQLLF